MKVIRKLPQSTYQHFSFYDHVRKCSYFSHIPIFEPSRETIEYARELAPTA